jgi:hypothetical protein
MGIFSLNIKKLGDVGNILPGKEPIRDIVPAGHYAFAQSLGPNVLQVNPQLILKSYIMEETGKSSLGQRELFRAYDALDDGFARNKIDQLSGMGFLILSDGVLNVCRWQDDPECLDVIVPAIFELDDKTWFQQEVNRVGAFCSGEQKIYAHENDAWLRYLASERTEKDKLTYFGDFFK